MYKVKVFEFYCYVIFLKSVSLIISNIIDMSIEIFTTCKKYYFTQRIVYETEIHTELYFVSSSYICAVHCLHTELYFVLCVITYHQL